MASEAIESQENMAIEANADVYYDMAEKANGSKDGYIPIMQ
ncbi:hypothetical protein A2U01_0100674, partial [Trifolium medium]|nr:hypothetical protein [Trifolium medium]